jgi:peptidyl-prolyl cis-trans isomerase C
MKSVHFLAFAVVAILSLLIGYYVGANAKSGSMNDIVAAVESGMSTGDSSPASSSAKVEGKVLATVNGKEITDVDVTALYETLPAQYKQAPKEFVEQQLLEQLVSMAVIGQAAEQEQMAEQEEFKERLNTVRDQLLQEFYLKEKIEEMVTDEVVRAEYDKFAAEFVPAEEVSARHILLKNAEEAADIIKLLDDGGDFAELAKEYSTGPSGPAGGDLGYFTKDRMVPEFAVVAFELPTGEYTKSPVKTQFGYHVIKVEDKRKTQPPAFEEKEAEIRGEKTNSMVTELIDELKAAASIVLLTPKEDEKMEEKNDAESTDKKD